MTFSRTFTTPVTAGLDMRLDYGQVRVVVGTSPTVQVTLSTEDADDSRAAQAIRGAVMSQPGMDDGPSRPGTLVARTATYARLRVPDTGGGGASGVNVVYLPGGGISVSGGTIHGGVHMVGDRIYINGQEVRPGMPQQSGVKAEVSLPAGASFAIESDGAAVTHLGDPLAFVSAHLRASGSLTLRQVAEVDVETLSAGVTAEVAMTVRVHTTSGKVVLGQAGTIDVRSVSGKVLVEQGLYGDARINTVSGRIGVVVRDNGEGTSRRVSATSVSGRVEVNDPDGLYGRDLLRVSASSMSGRVEAPGVEPRRRSW